MRKVLAVLFLIPLIAFGAGSYTNSFHVGKSPTTTDVDLEMGDTGVFRWNDTSSKLQYSNDGALFQDIGSGGAGAGGVLDNFNTNPQLELNNTGYVAYDDGAVSVPIDGVGGSPGVTCARNTTNQLAGTGDLLLNKPAVNHQGEGCAYDFTIDKASSGGAIRIEFDFLPSANYVDDDITLHVYDKDGTSLLQQLEIYQLKSSTSARRFVTQFFPVGSNDDYRLTIHIATTNASAYSVQFDNFFIGRKSIATGPAMAYGELFTPSGSLSTNVNYIGTYDREGKFAIIHYDLSFVGTNTEGSLTLNLPPGLTADSLTNPDVLIDGYILDATAGRIDLNTCIYSGGVLYPRANDNASSIFDNTIDTSVNRPLQIASGDKLKLTIRIPISGWDTGMLYSENISGSLIATQAYLSTAANHTSVSSFAKVPLDATQNDESGGFVIGSNHFLASESGYYNVSGNISFSSIASGKTIVPVISINDGNTYIGQAIISGGTGVARASMSALVKVNAGDTISLRAFQDDSATEAYNLGADDNFLHINKHNPNITLGYELQTTIGNTVKNGDANAVLYVDGSGDLATDSDLTWSGWSLDAPNLISTDSHRTDGSVMLNYSGGDTDNSFVNWYSAGNTTLTASIYQQGSDDNMLIRNYEDSHITFLTNNQNAMQIQNDKGIYLYGTGGNGGNVPHFCERRSATNASGSSVAVSCAAGERVMGGGCDTSGNINLRLGWPLSDTSFICAWTTSNYIMAWAICCDY